VYRVDGVDSYPIITSATPGSDNYFVFRRNAASAPSYSYTNARLAFYSIGEGINLTLLDARVTTLVNQIKAAIP
jgi:hypothetical protein